MSMTPVPRTLPQEDQLLIDEFLKNGGKVTQCENFQYSENIEYTGGFYGRRKKQKEEPTVDEDDNNE